MQRTFYIVTPKSGARASDYIGTVLGKCTALHVAVTVCQTMSDDLLQHWSAKKLLIVESSICFAEGDEISVVDAIRVFDSGGTRLKV